MYKIGISGKGGSGKDTLCKILSTIIADNYSSFEFKSQSFSDPVKKIVNILFPQIPKQHLYGPSKFRNEIVKGILLNGNPVTVRDLLIDVGESYKKYDPELMVNIFHNKSKDFCSKDIKSKFLIATDIRFPVEFEYAKREGFKTIRIIRDNCLKSSDNTETIQNSISDSSFDYVILNNGSLFDLEVHALNIFTSIT